MNSDKHASYYLETTQNDRSNRIHAQAAMCPGHIQSQSKPKPVPTQRWSTAGISLTEGSKAHSYIQTSDMERRKEKTGDARFLFFKQKSIWHQRLNMKILPIHNDLIHKPFFCWKHGSQMRCRHNTQAYRGNGIQKRWEFHGGCWVRHPIWISNTYHRN